MSMQVVKGAYLRNAFGIDFICESVRMEAHTGSIVLYVEDSEFLSLCYGPVTCCKIDLSGEVQVLTTQ